MNCSDRTTLAELFPDAFRAAPHLNDLGAALPDFPQSQFTAETLPVEPLEHAADGLCCGRLAETLSDRHPPMPIGPGIWLGVDHAQVNRCVDVPVLVIDPQIELEVGPIGRQ